MERINVVTGPLGGSQDNFNEFMAKAARNFALLGDTVEHAGRASLFDHFLGDVLHDRWAVTAGSDSPAAGAILADQPGGVCRLTTGDSNVSLAADGIQICSFLNYQADRGDLVFLAKAKIDVITTYQLFLGLTDQRAALEMPATLSGTTYTTNFTDGCGFLLDTSATTPTIRLVGVANDVDATHQDTGLAHVAATYKTFRIDVSKAGVATFSIDGVQVGTPLSAALRNSIPLTPVVCARSLTTAARNVDLDYLGASQLT